MPMGWRLLHNSAKIRRRTKRVDVEPPARGYKLVDDGEETLLYEVLISDKRLHEAIEAAAKSKGGRSISGPLMVRILSRSPRP